MNTDSSTFDVSKTRKRPHEDEQHPETKTSKIPKIIPNHGIGSPDGEAPSHTIDQASSQQRSFSGSSTSSSRTARVVLLNRPLEAMRKPGAQKRKRFSVFNALLSHTDILIQIASHLAPRTLVYLYSISAPFHYIVNSHYTQFILASSKLWAPEAHYYFPWRCYRELCIDDPALRRPVKTGRDGLIDRKTGRRSDQWEDETLTSQESVHGVKAVPGFRWLKMVTYREIVCREIVAWLAVDGHRTPVVKTVNALKKMWFLLDVPLSQPRIALIHNTAYFTNQTLAVLTMFLIKLDMYFTDPINFNGGEHRIRELLLSERSLTTLWNWLRRAAGTERIDALILHVKYTYTRPPRLGPETQQTQQIRDERAKMSIMGIPPHLVGRSHYECYGLGDKPLIRPDELIMRESIRRKLGIQRQWLRMIRWGFVDGDLKTMKPVKPEEVVLSLIKRRRDEEAAEKEKLGQVELEKTRMEKWMEESDSEDGKDPLADVEMLEEMIKRE